MECFLCNEIKTIKKGKHPGFIKEMESGYWILKDDQYYQGYSLFIMKTHKDNLPENINTIFLSEMVKIGAILQEKLTPKLINYAILCNQVNHVHAHIIPRYAGESNIKEPIWAKEYSHIASPEELSILTKKIIL